MERLIHQTLMVFVTSVTDLLNFQAKFYGCDTNFMCSYKDLGLAKKNFHLSNEFRSYEKKNVKVTIDSINNDNV